MKAGGPAGARRCASPRRGKAGVGYGSTLLLVGALLAAAGCRRSDTTDPSESLCLPAGTPVVLVSIDTLRSDRLPIYGYDMVATPAIDRLRRDSILFARAYTHISLTLPSHSSILSGLLPFDHGVRDNIGYDFPEDVPTLSGVFKQEGYATGAFVSSYVLRAETGLARGFDVYDDDAPYETGKQLGLLQRPGNETLAKALEWLRQVHREPFFLFFHIYEPHAPYEPPAPFAGRYAAAYDGEVAAADAFVGGLVAELERLGLYDGALIVLLSDHGEGLMDHGEMDHLVLPYREVLQVPLLLKLPGRERAGTTISVPAQLTDVAPTIGSLLGLAPDPRTAGTSLLALDRDTTNGRLILSESVYPRIHFGWSELVSMIDGDLHFIDGPEPELFDLRQDPLEKTNLIQSRRGEARRLRDEIGRYDRALHSPAEVEAETRERLAALGYLSGGVKTATGSLPDPRSRVHVITELGRAASLARDGKHAEAASTLAAIAEAEPRMPFVWQQLASVLKEIGDSRGALDAMVEAFELSGGRTDLAVSAADLYLELGDLEQAQAHAELALPSLQGYLVLASVALRQEDLDAAERHLEQARAKRGSQIQPLILQSALLNKRGLHAEALAVCDEAEAEFGDRGDGQALHALFFERGTALGSLGRFAEAEEAFERSIGLAPGNLEAYSALAFLYALENRGPEAGAVLERMVTENPIPTAYAEAVRTLRAMQDEVMARKVLAQARRRWPDNEELRRL
jgi:choline-sulfatase